MVFGVLGLVCTVGGVFLARVGVTERGGFSFAPLCFLPRYYLYFASTLPTHLIHELRVCCLAFFSRCNAVDSGVRAHKTTKLAYSPFRGFLGSGGTACAPLGAGWVTRLRCQFASYQGGSNA